MSRSNRLVRKVSDQTWALIRSAYLSGLSAGVVAHRFGVSEAALRKRATRERWTKQAFAETRVPTASAEPARRRPPYVSLDPRVLAKTAIREAAVALVEGRPHHARACAAAGEAMARLVDRIPEYQDVDSVQEGLERQKEWMEALAELSIDVADKMLRGVPLPPEVQAAMDSWRKVTGRTTPGVE
jgi:hypothetical protein